MTRLDDAFLEYHEQNPGVYQAFKEVAFKIKSTGRKHFGAKCIMEYIRFQTMISGQDEFKINNNYTSRYVRLLEEKYPQFDGFFSKRSIDSGSKVEEGLLF